MKINSENKKYSENKTLGFTVLETLVAISIILIAITGPLVVISQSLKASLHARDEIVAFYMAQEAIEYARLLRDNNILPSDAESINWLTNDVMGPGALCENPAGLSQNRCVLIYNATDGHRFDTCNAGLCSNVTIDSGGIYGATGDGETIFKREIYFNKVLEPAGSSRAACLDPTGDGCDDREVSMTVVVTWTNPGGLESQYSTSERLFNWKTSE